MGTWYEPASAATRLKMSIAHKGKKLGPMSDYLKDVHRANMVEQLESTGRWASQGCHESTILDAIEQREGITIDRHFKVLGYMPDGYCHETNTVYEVYEKHHNRRVQKDLLRETKICNHLSCDFIIIWDI